MVLRHSFRNGVSIAVRYRSEEERLRLLDALERAGFPVSDRDRLRRDYSSTDTNVYAVNIKKRYYDYLGQPSICAAMAGSGVRFYSAAEFCQMAEAGFSERPQDQGKQHGRET